MQITTIHQVGNMTIYLEQTLAFLFHSEAKTMEEMQDLLQSGVMKQSQSGINYLVIEDIEENTENNS